MDAGMTGRLASVVVAGFAALAALQASAQSLVDPTRPPNATYGDTDVIPTGPQLQSIRIATNRRLAIINGTTVAVGGMVGEAKVVRITESEVTLQKGDETEVLKLYPGVDKQPIKRSAKGAAGSPASQRSPQGRTK
jgi:MSHA biogenesis protein MshK